MIKTVAIIVAHPDDETLWTGGLILNHPEWNIFIISLCRALDKDRADRYRKALKVLKSKGAMGNLDDEPDQHPILEETVEEVILKLLPDKFYDLIITHNPTGEYTKHLRHEETSKAVITLWHSGKLSTLALWTFAYEDGNKAYYPKALKNADYYQMLSAEIWQEKYNIIRKIYGFEPDGWEARTTPKAEAFWQFSTAGAALKWLENKGKPLLEILEKT